jgi:hypothetical protein
MKFSMSISNRNLQYSDYLDDTQDTFELFHRLYVLYSRNHILLTKSIGTNCLCTIQGTLVKDDDKFNNIPTYYKGEKIIQTKVAAMKLQGFNPLIR